MGRAAILACLACVVTSAGGCGALRPLRGIPSNYYPAQLEGTPRTGRQTIDLSLLRQTPPDHYRLDSGDVLGVIAEGVLGRPEDVPPVYYPTEKDVPPSLGYPIPVREDGTISLPYAPPLPVRGLTVAQAENLIRETYTVRKQILRPGEDRILVSLQRPRTYSVLVIRQEAQGQELGGQGAQAGSLLPGMLKRGPVSRYNSRPTRTTCCMPWLKRGGCRPGRREHDLCDPSGSTRRSAARSDGAMPYHAAQLSRNGIQPVVYTDEWNDLMPAGGHIRQAQAEEGAYVPAPTEQPQRAWPGHTGRGIDGGPTENPPGGYSPPQPAPAGQVPFGPPPGHSPPGFPQKPPRPAHAFPMPQQPVPQQPMEPAPMPEGLPQEYAATFGRNAEIVRIPIRLHPGETPEFGEEDVILSDGDIVFIETRETEVFYTGGLLGGGQYMLPRDYDIDIVEAISIASGRGNTSSGGGGFGNRIGGVASLNQDISVGASDVVILRKTPDGNLIPIRVDLRRADRDPKHRLRVLPGTTSCCSTSRTRRWPPLSSATCWRAGSSGWPPSKVAAGATTERRYWRTGGLRSGQPQIVPGPIRPFRQASGLLPKDHVSGRRANRKRAARTTGPRGKNRTESGGIPACEQSCDRVAHVPGPRPESAELRTPPLVACADRAKTFPTNFR